MKNVTYNIFPSSDILIFLWLKIVLLRILYIMIPGPKYVLRTLTGYNGHDVTKQRMPAYSALGRNFFDGNVKLPGPKYSVGKVTRNGRFTQSYALVLPRRDRLPSRGKPGPKYKVDKIPTHSNSPGWYFGLKRRNIEFQTIPGPKYAYKTHNVPGIVNSPHWVFGVKPSKDFTSEINSPGPGRYKAPKLDSFRKKAPAPVILKRHQDKKHDIVPGPKYKGNKLTRAAPSWSFGLRHSKNQVQYRTSFDSNIPSVAVLI